MCGIIGIIGKQNENVIGKILDGLEKLEYRGYDSSGIAVVQKDNSIFRARAVGKLANLKKKLDGVDIFGRVGIGHTRWATHGKPTENNAHPMMSKDVALIHNGIIENYKELKFSLESDGYVFDSETDTEVIAHLLQRELSKGFSPRESMRNAMQMMTGAYAIAAIFSSLPGTIVVAREKSPLAVGFGENLCIGSDAGSLSNFCDEVAYLQNGDIVEISDDGATFLDKNHNQINRDRVKIERIVLKERESIRIICSRKLWISQPLFVILFYTTSSIAQF